MSSNNMRKFLIIMTLIFVGVGLIYYATPYQYWFAKFLSVVRPGNEYSRTAYSGYVKINSTALDDIIVTLRGRGCAAIPAGATEEGAIIRCYYNRVVLQDIGDALVVYPNGMGWGPVSFTVTSDKIFFSKDISGKPDIKKLKADIREDASFTGVQIRENSWKLKSVRYPWDVIY